MFEHSMPPPDDASHTPARHDHDIDALVAGAPARLAAMTTVDEVFDLVREAVPVLFPDCVVLLYRASPDGAQIELTDVLGLEDSIVTRALGYVKFEPRGRRYDVEPRFREVYARTTLHRFDAGLADFATTVLPAAVATSLEKLLGIHEIHAIGLAHGERAFGVLNVFTRKRGTQLRKQAVESFAHQCFLAMAGIHSTIRLRESEAQYRALLESLPMAVQVVHAGETVYCNPAGLRLYGLEPGDEARRMQAQGVVHEPDRPAFATWLRASEVDSAGPVELRVARSDGTLVPVELSSERVTFDGRPSLLLIARDLTRQRQGEAVMLKVERDLQHAQKLEGLGALAGGVAHEFNNALAIVLGNLSLASLDMRPSDPRRQMLEDATLAAQRAVGVTRQMLAYVGQRPNAERSRLSDVVREIETLLRMAVPRHVKLDLRLSGPSPFVEVDAAQIQQAVLNVVNNAAEAFDEESGTIRVTTSAMELDDEAVLSSYVHPVPEPGSFACVEVADDAGGMAPEVLERVFEPFFTTKFIGRGLGLAVVHGTVRAHQGAVLVDSGPGRGTRVSLLLPVSEQQGSEPDPA